MIEVSIPNDILKYESKLIGPFTTRQTVSLIASGIVGFGLYKLFQGVLPMETLGYLIVILIVPILAIGWWKPYNIPLEKFAVIIFISLFLSPKIRKYQINNYWENELLNIEKAELDEKTNQDKQKKVSKKKNKKKKGGVTEN